jgi:ubiquinone/menaquinone biosynthesis C-methylase UbiE
MIAVGMNAIVDRYDTNALDYARYWAPVLARTSRRLLDEIAPAIDAQGGRARLLDVGSGTGVVALGALARWPAVEVIATDAAAAMLDVARAQASHLTGEASGRLSLAVGSADELPLADQSVDIVLSSFVLQLVPDRPSALREALRVLRAGGRLAYVTWLDRDSSRPFRPTEEFDEAVWDLEIEEEEVADEPHAGDLPSARAAERELRAAGFRRVSAREDELIYDWDLESYLEYKLAYDERALMATLNEEQQQRLEDGARRRLAVLSADDFRWHAPIVFATGIRPGSAD